MKRAAIQDYWNRLDKVPSKSQGIVRIDQISDRGAMKTLETDGIFAIIGLNGAGKSCFLEFLTDTTYARLPFLRHQISLHDGSILAIPGQNLNANIIDPSAALRKNNEVLEGFRTTFGQQDPIQFKGDETSLLNYVLGSTYDQFSVEEIQISDSEVCTRFIVTCGTLTLDNDSLSLGEQLVMYIYWALTKKFQTPGIYFIEEPESGLSPAAQKKLVDMLVYISAEKGKQIFISTHSPFIVSRLGHQRLILLKKGSTAQWVNAGKIDYLDELGMDLGLQGIFYVEDNKARIFLKKILSLYGSDITKTHDVIFLGGEAEVYEVVYRLPEGTSNFRTFGILDADQKHVAKYRRYPNRFLFLPGTLPPEQEVLSAVTRHQEEFARALFTHATAVADAMRRCQGLNHHDYFEELSRMLYGEVRASVYEQAFGVWFRNYQNRLEIEELVRAIDSSVSQENIDEVNQIFPVQVPAAV